MSTIDVHPYLPDHLDDATRRLWRAQAPKWIAAACEGRLDDVRPSLGQGFWTHWRSIKSGRPPIHLLLSQGRTPAALDLLLDDGLDLHGRGPNNESSLLALASQPPTWMAAWLPVLHAHGVDWDVRSSRPERPFSLIQDLVSRRHHAAVDQLLHWGVPLASHPDPVLLATSGSSNVWPMLRVLRQHGHHPKSGVASKFYERALPALPFEALPWCQEWGLPLVPTPAMLVSVLRHRPCPMNWVEWLVRHNLDFDAPIPTAQDLSVRQWVSQQLHPAVARHNRDKVRRDQLRWVIGQGEAQAQAHHLHESLPVGPEPTRQPSPRPRL